MEDHNLNIMEVINHSEIEQPYKLVSDNSKNLNTASLEYSKAKKHSITQPILDVEMNTFNKLATVEKEKNCIVDIYKKANDIDESGYGEKNGERDEVVNCKHITVGEKNRKEKSNDVDTSDDKTEIRGIEDKLRETNSVEAMQTVIERVNEKKNSFKNQNCDEMSFKTDAHGELMSTNISTKPFGVKCDSRNPNKKNRSMLETTTAKSVHENYNKTNDIDKHQCRVCLVKGNLTNIFEIDNNKTIADKVMAVCPDVCIKSKDLWPHHICNTCLESVEIAYDLKLQCETTNKNLYSRVLRSRNHMQRPSTEFESLDIIKYPSTNGHDNNEMIRSSMRDQLDQISNYESAKRSERISRKEFEQSRIREIILTPNVTPKSIALTKTTDNLKRSRQGSSSPEVDFSSGSEDDYKPPTRIQCTQNKIRKGPGPGTVNAPKPALCSYCNEMLPSRSALMKHQKIHTIHPLNCDICCRVFKRLGPFQSHLNKHKLDGDVLQCDNYEKAFTDQAKRKVDLIEMNNVNSETFVSDNCKQALSLKKTLAGHLEEIRSPGSEANE